MREPYTDELGLGDYLSLFRRRWRWVALTTLLVLAAAAAFTLPAEKVYRSRAEVLILTEESATLFSLSSDVEDLLVRNPLAELDYLESRRFAVTAEESVGGNPTSIGYTLVSATPSEDFSDRSVIQFIAEGSDPDAVFFTSNAYAGAYIDESHEREIARIRQLRTAARTRVNRLEREREELEEPIVELRAAVRDAFFPVDVERLQGDLAVLELDLAPSRELLTDQINETRRNIALYDQVISELGDPSATTQGQNLGEIPDSPISPNVPRNLIVAGAAGLVLGLIAAIARDLLDTRARDSAEIAQLVDVPVIAAIGELPSQRSAPGRVRRFVDLTDADASGYRVLLNSLWLSTIDGPLHSIAFTSDRPGVGKTQTVVNLAQAEALRGTKVLIVDTDFLNPSVATRLELERSQIGLGDLLGGDAVLDTAVTRTGIPNLDLIDAFTVGEHAGDLLRSDKLRMLLTELFVHYDLIILDSPPTLSNADSRLVASQADAAVVVYDPSESRINELQRAIELLRSARVNLIGLVANRSRASHPVYVSARDG